MLKNDGSIDKIEEDKLNRKDFIERIIEGILGYKDKDSLVIGLEGNWGSGSNTKEALKEVSKSLMKISYILKPITTITGVVPIVGNMTKGIKELGKSYDQFFNTIDLETIKKGVTEALEKEDEKIIIFIDDLDRLLDSEICEVYNLCKVLEI